MTILHLMTSNSFFPFNFSISHERLCSETSHHFNDLRAIVNFKVFFGQIPAHHSIFNALCVYQRQFRKMSIISDIKRNSEKFGRKKKLITVQY